MIVLVQIMSLHPNSRYVYIGETTLAEKDMQRECMGHVNSSFMAEMYLKHVRFVLCYS